MHFSEVQIRQHVHAAQRTARMAGRRVMYHLDAKQTRLGSIQLKFLQFGLFHMNSFLCSIEWGFLRLCGIDLFRRKSLFAFCCIPPSIIQYSYVIFQW